MKQNKSWDSPTDSTLGLALFGSTIWVIFLICLKFFGSYNQPVNYMAYPYIFLCLVYPIILLLLTQIKTISLLLMPYAPMTIARTVCLWANCILLIIAASFEQNFLQYCIYGILYLYLFLVFFQKSAFFNRGIQTKNYRKISCLFVSISFVFIYLETFFRKVVVDYYDPAKFTIYNTPSTFFLFIFVVSVIFYALFSNRINNATPSKRWLVFLTYLSPLLLFDVENSFEIEHYNAYIGPAISVLHGQVPLLDVFCQYGLNYLIFTLAFLFLPNNYGIAALVVSLLNTIYFIVLLAILRTVIKNPYHFFIIGVSTLFGIYFSIGFYPPNLFPSSLAFRYLPVTLFLLYLLKNNGRESTGNDLKTAILLFLNILWGLESFIFSTFIFVFYLFLNSKNISMTFKATIKPITYLLLMSFASVFLYWITFGSIPNYLLYAEHLYSYIHPSSEIGIITKYSLPYYPVADFIPVLPIVMSTFTFFYFSIFYNKSNDENKDPLLKNLYLINFFGIIFLSYKALRSSGDAIYIMLFISFIPLLYFFGYKIQNSIIKLSSKTILFITLSSFITLSFFKILYLKPSAETVNNGLIGHLVHFGRPWPEPFLYNLSHFCTNRSQDSFIRENTSDNAKNAFSFSNCQYDTQAELREILDKKLPKKEGVMLFNKNSVESLFENHKHHLCLPNPVNDELFPEIAEHNIKRCLASSKNEDFVIIEKALDLYDIELAALEALSNKFALKTIDETKNFIILKLKPRDLKQSSDFMLPIHFTNKTILINREMAENMSNTTHVHERGITTILVDLKEKKLIDKIRIWKKPSNKNPIFIQHKNLFIHSVDLSVSDDGKKWIAVSHDNRNNPNQQYHEINFQPITAHYVKFAFSDEEKRVYIRRIDVFSSASSG